MPRPEKNADPSTPASGTPQLPPYQFIHDENGWQQCLKVLRRAPRIALDLESNSLYAYRDSVCLIQISTAGHDFIVDPLAEFSLEELGGILADPRTEKVFHASEYDLILIKREYGWEAANIFDTMWAARVLGYSRMGLAWFLSECFGVTQPKRFQKTNWCKRPLSTGQLAYAQTDTHFLLALRDRLGAELRERGLWEEAREIFEEAVHVRAPERCFDPEGFWTIRGARDLTPRQLAILRELFVFRDDEARRRNAPPFKVLTNQVLLSLAQLQPESVQVLRSVPGMAESLVGRYGRKIVESIEQARHAPEPKRPRPAERPPEDVSERYDRLLQWRKQLAQQRGVESDVILPRDTLWHIARRPPQCLDDFARDQLMGPKRIEMYAEDILEQLD
jgi:ribonuclease D